MRMLDLLNRRALGLAFTVMVVVWGIGLSIIGMNPSDAEMHLTFWPAMAAGFVVAMVVVHIDHDDGVDDH